jgi:uncharacterized protein
MTETALVTGGTSGLGAEFARQLAAEGSNLVLVARDVERLDANAAELRSTYGVEVEVLAADLSTPEGVSVVEARLLDGARPIDLLVNNAGFGKKGGFLEVSRDTWESMIDVNVTAVVRLAHAALTGMTERKHGGVLNVSSVAGFTPAMRPSSTYAATKAFVTAFTEGVAHSFERSGVHITAVCPGFVRTEFHERAGHGMSKMPKFMWLESPDVVRQALVDHRRGKTISVPGVTYKVIVIFAQYAPRPIWHFLSKQFGKRAK